MVEVKPEESSDETPVAEIHPANYYTLWFHQKQGCEESWSNNLLEISTGTAAEILLELNHFGLPSAPGRSKCDVCIFRSHIVPMWEDPHQERGGRWVVELKRDKIDIAWYRSLMGWFRTGDSEWKSVTGIYLMVRTHIKIALWFADSQNIPEMEKIRKHWGKVIGPELIKNAVCHTYVQV